MTAILLLAVALRLPTLSQQSFWLDEGHVTVATSGGFSRVFDWLSTSEAHPPLFYVIAWTWAQLFGDADATLRTISAVAGIATVVVAYGLGRRLGGPRAGLIAAAFAACSPLLVWFSQEFRAYALATFFSSWSLLLLVEAVEQRDPRKAAGWGVLATLAIWTHYFTGFIVVPSALLLVARSRSRAAVLTVACVGVATLGAAALALTQAGDSRTDWLRETGLSDRLTETARSYVSGPTGAPGAFLGALAFAGLAVATAVALRSLFRARLGLSREVAAIGAIALIAPTLLAIAGGDYVTARNLLFAWVPLMAVLAGALAAWRWGTALAIWIATAFLAITVAVQVSESHHRDDWQSATRELGPPRADRLLVIAPASSFGVLAHYDHPVRLPRAWELTPREIVAVGDISPDAEPPAGYRLAQAKRFTGIQFVRYVTTTPRRLTPVDVSNERFRVDSLAAVVEE